MFDDLNILTGWDSNRVPEKEVILISSKSADGSFLLHHFLSMFLKANHNVVLLTASQTLAHYGVVCSKFSVNIEKFQNLNKLKVMNILDASLLMYDDGLLESPGESPGLFQAFEQNSMKYIYEEIKKNLDPESRNMIMLDDITVLLNIGFKENDLINFVHYMAVLSKTCDCTFLTHFQKEVSSVDNAMKFYEHCQFYSTSELQIQGLESGYSKDVNGNLCFVTKSEGDLKKREKVKEMQYKLTDRSIKLFAPGTSSAVL